MWQDSKTQIGTKLKLKFDKNQFVSSFFLVKTTWHLDNQWDGKGALFCDLAMFLIEGVKPETALQ